MSGKEEAALVPADAAVPNLDLNRLLNMQRDFKKIQGEVAAKNETLRKYQSTSGVRIPVVYGRDFGTSVNKDNIEFAIRFGGYVLHTHGAEDKDSEALNPNGYQIDINVSKPSDDDEKIAAASSVPPAPTTFAMSSRTNYHFESNDLVKVKGLESGQLLILTGVYGRSYLQKDTNTWAVSFKVGDIEVVDGLSLPSLWGVAGGVGSGYLLPNDMEFEEGGKKYNYGQNYMISVWAEGITPDDEKEAALRMGRERGGTSLDVDNFDEKTFCYGNDKSGFKAKAALRMTHMQWATRDYDEKAREIVLINATFFDSLLGCFGIPLTNIKMWTELAPLVFSHLDMKFFGCVNAEGSTKNFSGVDSDKSINFALEISPNGVIPNLVGMLKRAAIRVDADCVRSIQAIPDCVPSGPAKVGVDMAKTDEEFFRSLPDVVVITGESSNAVTTGKLIGTKAEFRVLINYPEDDPDLSEHIRGLSIDDGSKLVLALLNKDTSEINNDAALKSIYSRMRPKKAKFACAYAICTDIIPDDVKSRRNQMLITMMSGRNPADTRAISASAAASASAGEAPASTDADGDVVPAETNDDVEDIDEGDADDTEKDRQAATTEDAMENNRKRSSSKKDKRHKKASRTEE